LPPQLECSFLPKWSDSVTVNASKHKYGTQVQIHLYQLASSNTDPLQQRTFYTS
jgi:hypothetical protein